MRVWICFWILVCGLNLEAVSKLPADAPRLRVGKISDQTARAGDSLIVQIPITIASGYHVNANPASSEDYIPLEVRFDSTSGIRPQKVIYPLGKKWRLDGTTEDLLVYGGDIVVKVLLIIDHSMKPVKRAIKGSVDFQACDNHVCFLPTSASFVANIEVIEAK